MAECLTDDPRKGDKGERAAGGVESPAPMISGILRDKIFSCA